MKFSLFVTCAQTEVLIPAKHIALLQKYTGGMEMSIVPSKSRQLLALSLESNPKLRWTAEADPVAFQSRENMVEWRPSLGRER